MLLSRRRFLYTAGLTGAALALDRLVAAQPLKAPSQGRLIKSMPLGRLDGRPQPPLNQLLDKGLDARLFTDLSSLAPDRLMTPNEAFYVRTSAPRALPGSGEWRIALGDAPAEPIALSTLSAQARSAGAHVLECAGNSDPANFGLLSAAEWSGVPIAALFDRLGAKSGSDFIRVTGQDDETLPSLSSIPGASWIFTRDELERQGAFLGFGMNGRALPPDHGAPVRLVVPGYYGCSCIKWIVRIDRVGRDAASTSQMREFAARTEQRGVPDRAQDYEPPVIDLAATPVRVEQWTVDGHIVYRVVGIRWGGRTKHVPLTIRFRHAEAFVPVEDCPDAVETTTWSLWSHIWRPQTAGRYQIVLAVADRSIRTRRLDAFYYTREVEIDRV